MARDKGEGRGKYIISVTVSSIGQVGDKVRGKKGLAETARYAALSNHYLSARRLVYLDYSAPE